MRRERFWKDGDSPTAFVHVPPGIRDSGFIYATGGVEAVPSCLGTAETPPNDAAFLHARAASMLLSAGQFPARSGDVEMSRCRNVVDESMSWTTPWKKEKKQRGGAVLGDEGVFGDCRPLALPFAIGTDAKRWHGWEKEAQQKLVPMPVVTRGHCLTQKTRRNPPSSAPRPMESFGSAAKSWPAHFLSVSLSISLESRPLIGQKGLVLSSTGTRPAQNCLTFSLLTFRAKHWQSSWDTNHSVA